MFNPSITQSTLNMVLQNYDITRIRIVGNLKNKKIYNFLENKMFVGIAKVFVLWYKNTVFGDLIDELAGIWPMPPLDENASIIKEKSLAALRVSHRCKSHFSFGKNKSYRVNIRY